MGKVGYTMSVKVTGLFLTAGIAFCVCLPVKADISYGDVYASAVSDAMARHYEILSEMGEGNDTYSAIGYTLSDITGDGIDELIIRQVLNKHLAEYWIYGTDGASCYYMGEFDCDAAGYNGDLYGYAPGVLYEEAYKGSVSLGAAEWNGNGFTVSKLYEGSYDRNGNPPSIPDLSAYYDSNRLLYEITDLEELTEGTIVRKKDSASDDKFDLNNYAYRTVITNEVDGALVFQTEPYGNFMFDYEFWNGDQLLVNLDWRQDGYAIAYQDGVYGYVDAGYIDW